MNRTALSAFSFSALSIFFLCSCASVRYTERPDGSREFRSLTLAKDVSATHKTPTSETVISSSSAEATHTVGNLGAVALGALAGGAVAGPAGAGVGAAGSVTLAELWQTLQDRLDKPTTAPSDTSTPSTPPSTASTQFTQIWPSFPATRWCEHGTGDAEDIARNEIIAGAAAAGQECLAVPLPASMPNACLRIELFKWAHPERTAKQGGTPWFKEDNWYCKARAAGIKRWVMILPPDYNRDEWRDTLQAYSADELQVVCNGQIISL